MRRPDPRLARFMTPEMRRETNDFLAGYPDRLYCAEHPGRVAIAEVADTGLGMCRDCYRDHQRSAPSPRTLATTEKDQ